MNGAEPINIAYKIGCYICAISIAILLFDQYYENEDASVVVNKRFEGTNTDSFPAITLCLRSDGSDGLYNDQYILSKTGLTGNQYRDIMKGNIKIPNSTALHELNFEMATIQLQNYLTKFKIKDTNDNTLFKWEEEDSSDGSKVHQELNKILPLRNYQDPDIICYSYHTDHGDHTNHADHTNPNNRLESISFYFSIYKLQSIEDGKLYIYVHKKNQLVRSMRYIYKIKYFEVINYNNFNNQLVFDLNQISIMRSRKDANEPCNEDLQNDDAEWMQHVVTLIGCFPPYWRKMYSRAGNNFQECNTTEQLKSMSWYLPYDNERVAKSVLNMYPPPCEQMRVLANSIVVRTKNEKLLKIQFRFR